MDTTIELSTYQLFSHRLTALAVCLELRNRSGRSALLSPEEVAALRGIPKEFSEERMDEAVTKCTEIIGQLASQRLSSIEESPESLWELTRKLDELYRIHWEEHHEKLAEILGLKINFLGRTAKILAEFSHTPLSKE